MTYGINLLSIIAVREAPSDKSEMVNQLLFGEVFEVEKIQSGWAYISSAHDNYKGWIDKKQMVGIGEEEYNRLNTVENFVSTDIVQITHNKTTGDLISVVAGSSFPQVDELLNFNMAGRDFSYEGLKGDLINGTYFDQIPAIADMFKGAPYLWGGRSIFGLDCSGFTQIVFKIAGYRIARDSSEQAMQGKPVDFISSAKTGDLMFFDNDDGDIIHVGIYLENNKIIHAHGKVRVDNVDHHGIHNLDNRAYSHKLRLIKRMV
ncbi:MAG: C40 family peptidase [Bacteroidales bacterium]|nr:C40 family peptidase [Bacteroidales bacterium]